MPQVGNGDDAAMSVDYAPGVHFEKDAEIHPPASNQSRKVVPRLVTAGLSEFRRINETKPHGGLNLQAASWDSNASKKPIAIEYSKHRNPNGVISRFFRRN